MSNSRVLLQITGSIAAFKAAALASLLAQDGFDATQAERELKKSMGVRSWPKKPTVSKYIEDNLRSEGIKRDSEEWDEAMENAELFYYVGLRWD